MNQALGPSSTNSRRSPLAMLKLDGAAPPRSRPVPRSSRGSGESLLISMDVTILEKPGFDGSGSDTPGPNVSTPVLPEAKAANEIRPESTAQNRARLMDCKSGVILLIPFNEVFEAASSHDTARPADSGGC